MKLLGIRGSLRKESYNTKLLYAAEEFLPAGIAIRFTGCEEIPLYNGDMDGKVKPDSVLRLLEAIQNSDGILIAMPEYNYSIPGVLKNAIDWVSRPAYKSVLAHKPAGIISASKSAVGGARAQSNLQEIFAATLTPVVPAPALLVAGVQTKFNADGKLIDTDTSSRLDRYMQEFVSWVEQLSKGRI